MYYGNMIISAMNDVTITWWIVISALALLAVKMVDDNSKRKKRSQNFRSPPGPKGYPILGIFPSLIRKPAHIVFGEWSKKYGNVYQFTLGAGTSVVLGDTATVRLAMLGKSPDFDSRCQWRYCFNKMFRGLSVLPYSFKWVNTRRRTLTILRNIGMGRSLMEGKIHEETQCLLKCMLDSSQDGKVNFEPRDMLRRAPMNTIWSILFGKRYDYSNPYLLYVMNTVVWLVDFLAKASVFDVLPSSLRHLAGFSLETFHNKLETLHAFMTERVDDHAKSYESDVTRDFVDAWIKAKKEDKLKIQDSEDSNDISSLPDVIQDLIVAGAHSTGIVFNWAVLLLVLNKKEQDLCYREIMDNVGPTREISMSDRSKLRRVDAVMHECMRIGTVLPLVAHATARDTTIHGYNIKAGTEVIYNNWFINRNEKVFPDAEKFNPDRWIKKDGSFRKELLQHFFPFGIGKRSCAGESLARANLFIVVATLLQRVELLPPDETASPEMLPEVKHQFGLLAECKPFLMRVRCRPTFVPSQ
nr:cytochrome P450 2C15 [Ciona intestinalis]|eukprot:XP_002121765.3 cytochrome P450 2C15 [Ciona intestinalis]